MEAALAHRDAEIESLKAESKAESVEEVVDHDTRCQWVGRPSCR